MLYDAIPMLNVCDRNFDGYFALLHTSGTQFLEAWNRPTENPAESNFLKQSYLDATLSFTDSLGYSSYLARNCYASYEGYSLLKQNFGEQVTEYSEFVALVHENIAENYRDLNSEGWQTYLSWLNSYWQGFSFGWSRLAYLMFFQTVRAEVPTRLQTIYPVVEEPPNRAGWSVEIGYEFLRGTQIIRQHYLDVCEEPAMLFFNTFDRAKFIRDEAEDSDTRREGLF